MQVSARLSFDSSRPISLVATGQVIAVVAGIAAVSLQLLQLSTGFAVGSDFLPLRHAAQGLLSGTSVYADPWFVYPPSAAVPLLITAAGTVTFAAKLWLVVGILGLCGTSWQIATQADPNWRIITGGVSTFTLVIGCVANDSLFLGNLSVLLVPIAVWAMIAMGRGRWLLGCGLICASLLIKPLLVPLLIVPLWFGHGRELVRAVVPSSIALLLSIALVPGGGHFPHVLGYVLSGTNLHGTMAIYNLSISGWLEAHRVGRHTSIALRVVGAVAVCTLIGAALRRIGRTAASPAAIAQSGNLMLTGVLLVGKISEVHFLLIVLAVSLLQVAVQPWSRNLWLVPGMVMLGLPTGYRAMIIGAATPQSWYLVAEMLLLLGNVATSYGRTVHGAPANHAAPAVAAIGARAEVMAPLHLSVVSEVG